MAQTDTPVETKQEQVYVAGAEYWQSVPADVDGMLGGFAHLSGLDVKDSHAFLDRIQEKCGTSFERALDCGAGIGRVTKEALLPRFKAVDMVDVTANFIENSTQYLGELDNRVEKKFVCGLQDFTPSADRYDVIWVQWVSGHLTDDDFIAFFTRCKDAVRANGCVVLKENICPREEPDFDAEDNSWTRNHQQILQLFDRAGCRVVLDKVQKSWPKDMYRVRAFALQ